MASGCPLWGLREWHGRPTMGDDVLSGVSCCAQINLRATR